jgi:hypothetical protein
MCFNVFTAKDDWTALAALVRCALKCLTHRGFSERSTFAGAYLESLWIRLKSWRLTKASTTQAFARKKNCGRVGRAVLAAFAQNESSFAAALNDAIVASRLEGNHPKLQPAPLRPVSGKPSAVMRKRKAGNNVFCKPRDARPTIAPETAPGLSGSQSEQCAYWGICHVGDERLLWPSTHCSHQVHHMCRLSCNKSCPKTALRTNLSRGMRRLSLARSNCWLLRC